MICAELGGDGALGGADALEAVEDLVVLGAARGEHRDDVLDPAATDVRDVGLHVRAGGAGPGGPADPLLQAGRQPRQVEVAEHRRVLEVVALLADAREAQHRELAGGEPALERLELARVDAPVGDVRLDPVPLAQRAGELAQAPDALAEHDHLLLAGDPGERLGGHAAQQRQPVPSPAHRLGHEALANERGRERRLRVGQRLRIDARVDEHPDVPEHDPLRASELGQRLPVQLAAGFERLQLAQHLEQPPVGLPASPADRVEQLGERRVGVERERLARAGPRASTPACPGG